MREVITLQFGQAGLQLGQSFWDLLRLEHNLSEDSILSFASDNNNKIDNGNSYHEVGNELDAFFYETGFRGRYLPRSVMVDSEPDTMDEIRSGPLRMLFHPQYLISRKEPAITFPRAHVEMKEHIMDNIRRQADRCESLQGFQLFHGIGGGTGSGLTSLILEQLADDYKKKLKLDYCIFPSPSLSTSVVEQYNAVLSFPSLLEHNDMTMVLDNHKLYKIASNCLGVENSDFIDINHIVTRVASSFSAPIRFGGTINNDLAQMCSSLIVYPPLNFLLPSYAPLMTERLYHAPTGLNDLTNSALDSMMVLANCNPHQGKYLACNLTFSGDVTHGEIQQEVSDIQDKKAIDIVDWTPCGIRGGLSYIHKMVKPKSSHIEPPPRSLVMVSSNTSVKDIFKNLLKQFNVMYAKKAFVHWYTADGLSEEFSGCRAAMEGSINDYEECSTTQGLNNEN